MRTLIRSAIALICALTALVMFTPPASAAPVGWTDAVCKADPGDKSVKVCTNVYITTNSYVAQVQVCSFQTPPGSPTYAGLRKNAGYILGTNGIFNVLWSDNLANTSENQCVWNGLSPYVHVGNGATVHLSGEFHDTIWSDSSWATCQTVTSGAC